MSTRAQVGMIICAGALTVCAFLFSGVVFLLVLMLIPLLWGITTLLKMVGRRCLCRCGHAYANHRLTGLKVYPRGPCSACMCDGFGNRFYNQVTF